MRSRVVAFAVLGGLCVAAAVVAALLAVVGAGEQRARSTRAVPAATRLLAGARPFIAFRALNRDDSANYTRFSVAPLTAEGPGTPLAAGPLCVRLTFAAGSGMCLGQPGPTGFPVIQLDARMHEVRRFRTAGVPSRVRVSPDGHWAGVTAFITGHSYAQPGQFSTAATIYDLRSGREYGDLEKNFTVTRGGQVVRTVDRNFWGLTFAADGDTFYATLGSGGKTWLVRGSLARRTARTIHANVECPALSPDGTRIGYKHATGRPGNWRFSVLDLRSGRETRLAETRSIDDQLEWLDDDHLLYGVDNTTYVVPADGSGAPTVFLANADSPAVVRP